MTETLYLSALVLVFFLLLVGIPPVRKFVFQKPWMTILFKNLYTFFGKPYFKVSVFHHQEVGQVGVDAQYNIHFLYLLDAAYEEQDVGYYKKGMPEQAKIAIYLYDTMGSIAEHYMPLGDILNEVEDDIPPMTLRDGADPVRQVVDIANRGDGSDLEIASG